MSWYESQFPWQFLIKKSKSRSKQEPVHRASIPAEELGVAAWPVNKEPVFAVHGDRFVSQPPAVKIVLGFWDQDFAPYRDRGCKVWVWVTVTLERRLVNLSDAGEWYPVPSGMTRVINSLL